LTNPLNLNMVNWVLTLIREDQSAHEFIDASVVGLFRTQKEPKAVLKSSVAEAREQGVLVCGDPGTEPEWEVSWNIEPHPLR
jgi:hypothetical protein